MKFRKKQVIIEAEQFNYKDIDSPETINLAGRLGLYRTRNYPPSKLWEVKTLKGYHLVSRGDWIITGVKGEKYLCKPDIFAMTYEEIKPLTPTEKVALIKQSCPEIDNYVVAWVNNSRNHFSFTDYLTEQMEVKK